MRIGYSKIGRSMPLTIGGFGIVGGDDEPPFMLRELALRNPEHEFWIVGRNSGETAEEAGFPPNVYNPWVDIAAEVKAAYKGLGKDPSRQVVCELLDDFTQEWFTSCDGHIVWAGQHGTSNSPIPKVGSPVEDVTNPQISFVNYASYVVRGINAWRDVDPLSREEVWVIADARNYLKCRDLKWPVRHPVLGQFDFTKDEKHYRYGDVRSPAECGFVGGWDEKDDKIWTAEHRYRYSRLEICGIMPDMIDSRYDEEPEDRAPFGMFINEARAYVGKNRKDALRDYVLANVPDEDIGFIHGKWTDESLEALGRDISPAPHEDYYPLLRSVLCTFTTPSSGSGWATTKPWQAFAVGVPCLFHPYYDTQGHIVPVREQDTDSPTLKFLSRWLRVRDPEDFAYKYNEIVSDRNLWTELVRSQRQYYDWACSEAWHLKLIEERLGL